MSIDYYVPPNATLVSHGLRSLTERLSLVTRSRTSLLETAVTEEVADVIRLWEERPTPALASLDEFPRSPIAAVEFIAATLRLSQDDVCSAVGIAPRTYYGWKMHGHKPRARSLGTLWPMTRVVYLLKDSHPNLEEWFQGSREAQAIFREGDAEALALFEAEEWVAINPMPRVLPRSDFGPREDEYPIKRRIRTSTPVESRIERRQASDRHNGD